MQDVRVEKIIIIGASDDWKAKSTVTVEISGNTSEAEVSFTEGVNGKANVATIRDPKAPITKDWVIKF